MHASALGVCEHVPEYGIITINLLSDCIYEETMVEPTL